MSNPTISVVIPTYNSVPFVTRAIQSVLDQTLPVSEIIIVDDASTDNTRNFIGELAVNEKRIKLVCLPENRGPAYARNVGMEEAKGDWIIILDADDAITPGRTEYLFKLAQEGDCDIVLDGVFKSQATQDPRDESIIAPEGNLEVLTPEVFMERARPYGDEIDYGLLKPLLRRSFLKKHNLKYPDFSRHGEDFLFMLNALMAGGKCILTRKTGYLYTVRSSGLSRTRVNYKRMIRHSTNLLKEPRIKNNAALVSALQLRISSLKRLDKEYKIRTTESKMYGLIEDRNYLLFAASFVAGVTFQRLAFNYLGLKLRGKKND